MVREHDVNIACDWSTPPPRPGPPQCSTVFARVEIGLARATPGTKKNARLSTRLRVAKKERLGTALARPVTNKKRDHYINSQIGLYALVSK